MLLKKSTFVRKNDMIWQKYGVTQERGEERLTKKVRKKYVGGGSTAKECDATHSKKKKNFARDVLLDASWLLMYFLWVYLLMMLLAFYETNKPHISK